MTVGTGWMVGTVRTAGATSATTDDFDDEETGRENKWCWGGRELALTYDS